MIYILEIQFHNACKFIMSASECKYYIYIYLYNYNYLKWITFDCNGHKINGFFHAWLKYAKIFLLCDICIHKCWLLISQVHPSVRWLANPYYRFPLNQLWVILHLCWAENSCIFWQTMHYLAWSIFFLTRPARSNPWSWLFVTSC